jgi:hypothetical protein
MDARWDVRGPRLEVVTPGCVRRARSCAPATSSPGRPRRSRNFTARPLSCAPMRLATLLVIGQLLVILEATGGVRVRASRDRWPVFPGDRRSSPAIRQRRTLLVLGDDDGVRRISTRDVESIRAADPSAAARLGVAADALTDHAAPRDQTLRIHASARGQLGLAYVTESPVWRTTYRVVLPEGKAPGQLQAWAALTHAELAERSESAVAQREHELAVATDDLERLRRDLTALGAADARAGAKDKLVRRLARTTAAIDRARASAAADREAAGQAWSRVRAVAGSAEPARITGA